MAQVLPPRQRHKRELVINGITHYRCARCTQHLLPEAFNPKPGGKIYPYCTPCRSKHAKESFQKRQQKPRSKINNGDELSNDYLEAVARMQEFSRKTSLGFRGCMIVAIDTFIELHGGEIK